MKPDRNFQKAISAAYTLMGSVLILGGIGYFLFQKNNNISWLISFLLLGVIVGMYELYKHIK